MSDLSCVRRKLKETHKEEIDYYYVSLLDCVCVCVCVCVYKNFFANLI